LSDELSQSVNEFRGRSTPEPLGLAGYGALIRDYDLKVPLPPLLTGIAERHHPVPTNYWNLLKPRHAPPKDLGGHLEFGLKWEGVDLGVVDHGALGRKADRGTSPVEVNNSLNCRRAGGWQGCRASLCLAPNAKGVLHLARGIPFGELLRWWPANNCFGTAEPIAIEIINVRLNFPAKK
jgi:hypothetical protein